MKPDGLLVAAVWAEPERVPWGALPRRVLERYRPLPPRDPEKPGAFYCADQDRLARDLELCGFRVEHVEEMDVAVVEATSGAGIVAWVRDLGLLPLVNELTPDQQLAWGEELAAEAERFRVDDMIRLGGVTRLVVARRRS